jgi:hypothetical protein
MRRARAVLLVIVLVLPGCRSATAGPTAAGSVPGAAAAGLEIQVREAIRRFVDAYAATASDRGTALGETTRGVAITRWAEWVGVQFTQLDAAVTGSSSLESIRDVQAVTGAGGRPEALASIRAHVDFAIAQPGADVRTVSRSLNGPILLVRTPRGWKVADFTRDGLALTRTVYVFGADASLRDRGVEMVADVVIADPQEWFFGLTVRNGADATLAIAPDGVGLLDAKDQLIARGEAPTAVSAIPAGSSRDALIRFPVPADVTPEELRLFVAAAIAGDETPVVVAVPMGPILRALGRAGASASPSASS